LSLWQKVTPPQLFVGSFAMLVLSGAAGLHWLPGLYTGPKLGWLDALFTATSAVCVTGLIVVDTATFFTPLGQAYLLLLIQLGGLGMIAFTSLIILALGGRLSLRQEALSTTTLEGAPRIDTRRLVFDVIRFTLFLEGAGALLLYLLWIPRFGFAGAIWPAVFHSVSAFCNAGFSIFSDSLMSFQDAPFSLAVIMALIVFGGLGFLTLEELWLHYHAVRSKRTFRVSLHTRIVLSTTAVLIVGGWVCFCLFEWRAGFAAMSPGAKIVNGLFMSVTSRTAGYNAVDYGQATDSTNFLTIILMMIGGSPGSTAGGIKTTTFALIGLLAWSRFRGTEVTSIASRSLREETTDRAIGLFVVAFGVVTFGIFVLTATERAEQHFLERMFEAVSAFNTVGLSMGLTPDLTEPGRLSVILLMFLGRVGPLTLAAALATRRTDMGRFRFAYEEVAVG
jgi:trk system potassium uptake protein TrkH